MEREENAAEPQNHLYMCTACTVVRMVHVFFSPAAFLYGSLEQFDSPESPNPFAAADMDIVGSFQIVEIGMLLQVGFQRLAVYNPTKFDITLFFLYIPNFQIT